jgi:hypothetical protein
MIALHATVMSMLTRMYEEFDLQELLTDMNIAFEIALEDGALPYLCLDFTEDGDIAILDDIPDPPDTYRWN